MLRTVFGYADEGPIKPGLTKWAPRKVRCTDEPDHSDHPGVSHVVKLRDERATSSAALISEVVAGHLLEAGGIRTPPRCLVNVSPTFAESLAGVSGRDVKRGMHFGSTFLMNVADGPPDSAGELASPQHVVDLFYFDVWLCNFDRKTEGNTLLEPATAGKFKLFASDQSDCFGGATRLADGSWISHLQTHSGAEACMDLIQAMHAAGWLQTRSAALSKINLAKHRIGAAINEVPAEWWTEASIDSGTLNWELGRRASDLQAFLPNFEALDAAFRQLRDAGHVA
jgi:hypothetical protein